MSLSASASLILGNKDGNISPKAMQSLQKSKSQPSLFQNSQSVQENTNTYSEEYNNTNTQTIANEQENYVETTGTMAYTDSVETTGTMASLNNSFSGDAFCGGAATGSSAGMSAGCSTSISCVA